MTAIVKNSVLNPLATCFVPSNLKAFCGDKTIVTLKTVTSEVNADENSKDTKSTRRLNRPLTTTALARMKNKYFDDKKSEKLDKMLNRNIENSTTVVLFRLPSFVPESLPKVMKSGPTFYETETLGISSLILLNMVKLACNENRDLKSCAEISEVEETEESEINFEECLCPAIFGWVVPPTFFGNPLNLKYDCNKNYVHSPKYFGELKDTCIRKNHSLKNRNSTSIHFSEGKETLEQCSLEFQMIIRDVCDSVREEDPSELEGKGGHDYPETSDNLQVNEQEKTVWNNAPDNKLSNDELIIDDGSHPLLQSSPSEFSNEDEEACESIEVIENILEKCLLPVKESPTFDIESPITAVCNPPCSVWCESLPPAAKDAYKRFLKKYQRHTESNVEICAALNPFGRRPSFKRSFSADDAPMYAIPGLDLTSLTSEEESKERLLRLHKDPVAYFRNHALNDKRRHRTSYSDISNCHLRESCLSAENAEISWGPFDGADSLWKPLPDCMASNEYNQKPSYKKARELKRQRSLN